MFGSPDADKKEAVACLQHEAQGVDAWVVHKPAIDALEKAVEEQGEALRSLKERKGPKEEIKTAVAEYKASKAALKEAVDAAAAEPPWGGPREPAPDHPNTCTRLGEVVLYAQRLDAFVDGLARCGVTTHRERPPKALGDSQMRLATYFFGQPRMRLLVAGPADASADPAQNPEMWMFGRGAGHGSTELTGLLPVVRDMAALRAACGELGEEKKAAQEGRTIATLRQGAVPELTGTFAFLSDKAGEELW